MKKIAIFLGALLVFQSGAPLEAWDMSEEKGWPGRRQNNMFSEMEEGYRLLKQRLAEQREKEDREMREKYEYSDGYESAEDQARIRAEYLSEKEALEYRRKTEDAELEAQHDLELQRNFPDKWREIHSRKKTKEARGEKEIAEEGRETPEIVQEEWTPEIEEGEAPVAGQDISGRKADTGEKGSGFIEWIDKDGNLRRATL